MKLDITGLRGRPMAAHIDQTGAAAIEAARRYVSALIEGRDELTTDHVHTARVLHDYARAAYGAVAHLDRGEE